MPRGISKRQLEHLVSLAVVSILQQVSQLICIRSVDFNCPESRFFPKKELIWKYFVMNITEA